MASKPTGQKGIHREIGGHRGRTAGLLFKQFLLFGGGQVVAQLLDKAQKVIND
jgi:hypothetical protein